MAPGRACKLVEQTASPPALVIVAFENTSLVLLTLTFLEEPGNSFFLHVASIFVVIACLFNTGHAC